MARPLASPEGEARRLRGWELYLDSDRAGKRRSLRSIALELGVSQRAVTFWKEKDKWDERLDELLTDQVKSERQSAETTALLQSSLREHIETLNDVIRSAEKDSDKIKGVNAFVDIFRKLGVPLNPADNRRRLDFDDEVGDKSGPGGAVDVQPDRSSDIVSGGRGQPDPTDLSDGEPTDGPVSGP